MQHSSHPKKWRYAYFFAKRGGGNQWIQYYNMGMMKEVETMMEEVEGMMKKVETKI